MNWLAFSGFILFTGFVLFMIVRRALKGGKSYKRKSSKLIEFDEVRMNSKFVYESRYGIQVRVQNGIEKYPLKKDFDRVVGRYMRAFNVSAEEIQHAGYIFTSQPIDCDNCKSCKTRANGCSDGRLCVGLLEGDIYEWGWLIGQELGHVAAYVRTNNVDASHSLGLYPSGTEWL